VGTLPEVKVEALISDEASDLLREGRAQAWRRVGVSLDESSTLRPAIGYYTGRLYAEPGVRALLLDCISHGAHCVIISGGYGVVRAEELIHNYEAHLPMTIGIWRERTPAILRDYVEMQGIVRTLGCFSEGYGSIVPYPLAGDDWRHIAEGSATGPVLKDLSATWLGALRDLNA
jgi:hypothetical protein